MKKLILSLPFILMACTTPNSPAQDVYALESTYASGLEAELAYDALPICPLSAPLCATTTIKKNVRVADDTAYAALKAAEVAVRTPGNTTTATVLATANAAIGAFTTITATLAK